MTNESALLGLLADLQKRIYALQAENAQLREQLAGSGGASDLIGGERSVLSATPSDPLAVHEH